MTPSRQRHVVVIVMDTARADAFETYGAPAGATPGARDLAARGWAAPYAVAPSSWTLPSHVAFLLGRHHGAAGLTRAAQESTAHARPVVEANAGRYLPNVLRRNGYRTTGVSTNLWVQPHAGFGVGFDDFHELWRHRQPSSGGSALVDRARWVRHGVRSHDDDGLSAARTIVDGWIDEAAASTVPMFLFVNLVECHSPYLPPRPYNDLSAVGRARAALDSRRYMDLPSIWHTNLARRSPPEAALRRMRHLYDQSIRYMDDWLTTVVEQLDARGILDDTVLIVTSDHGENFGEGGRIGHAFSLDDNLLRVPFIASGTDGPPAGRTFSLVRLPHLIATEVGLSDHPYTAEDAGPDHGIAVAAIDGIADPADPRIDTAIDEWGLGIEARRRMTEPSMSASDGALKVVRHADRDDVFDLQADPEEVEPLSGPVGGHAAVVRRLQRAIDAATAAPADAAAPAPAVADAETERLKEQMRLLGYL